MFLQPPPPEPIRVARRSAIVGVRDVGVAVEGAGEAGREEVARGRGRGERRGVRGVGGRQGRGGGQGGRARGGREEPYAMRGVGGGFGVWVGRAASRGGGRPRRGQRIGQAQERNASWRNGRGGGHFGFGGTTRAPPAHERRGLSRAEWLRRVANRRPLPPAEPVHPTGPTIVVHYHHHHH